MRKITFKLLTKLPTKYVTTGILLIMLLFAYGIIGSHFIMGLNLIDSIYYSVVTMATVGYGDYIPVTGIQKIFATTLAWYERANKLQVSYVDISFRGEKDLLISNKPIKDNSPLGIVTSGKRVSLSSSVNNSLKSR